MNLSELQEGDRGKVVAITTTNKALKERLRSFGVKVHKDFLVKECMAHNVTMSIQFGKTVLALRDEEAKKIEVVIEQ